MKHVRWGLLLILLAAGANVQSKGDEEAVRRLPQAFCDAWAKHDGHAPPKIMAEDVDFVTVAATYLHGRADFEKFHTRLLGGRFRNANITAATDYLAILASRYGDGFMGTRQLRETKRLTARQPGLALW